MTLSLSDLERIHASLPDDATLDEPHPLSILKTFPSADEITVMTFNFFDNGPDRKVKWVEARYVMNLQVFTETSPFTPRKDLAAWTGAVQLHNTSFIGRYLTARFPVQEEMVRPMLTEADNLDPNTHTDVLLGQLFSKSGGTQYVWGTMLRTYVDDLGELNAELLHEGRVLRDSGFTPANNPKTPALKLQGRYDPLGLWKVGKPKKFVSKSKGATK